MNEALWQIVQNIKAIISFCIPIHSGCTLMIELSSTILTASSTLLIFVILKLYFFILQSYIYNLNLPNIQILLTHQDHIDIKKFGDSNFPQNTMVPVITNKYIITNKQ